MRKPKPAPHPGEILRTRYLEPLGVSITQAAEALGVSRKHVHAIVAGRAPVTVDMAVRLAGVFGTERGFWIGLQVAHDLARLLREVQQARRPKVKSLVRRTR
jgi:antitoxin HigA-1